MHLSAEKEASSECAGSKMTLGGRWQVSDRIGLQPYGSIYQAKDVVDGSLVEIEVLRAELFSSFDFWELNEFLENKFSPIQDLVHRSIDPLLSFGIHEGLPYLVYKQESQFTLSSLLKQQPILPVNTVREIAEHLLLSLSSAHQAGVMHFGLAPERVILTLDSQNARLVVVRGFGVAAGLASKLSNMSLLTRAGVTIAPPAYMAPELFSGANTDERADLYSLGAMFYQMLTGRAPFVAESTIDILLKLKTEKLTPISHFRPEYAEDPFVSFVETLLEKSANSRPSSASVCLTALRALPRAQISGVAEKTRSAAPKQIASTSARSRNKEREGHTEPRRRRDSNTHLHSALREESHRKRSWVGPVLLTAVLLNGILALLLVRATFRDREVIQLAKIEERREATKIATEDAARARLASPKSENSESNLEGSTSDSGSAKYSENGLTFEEVNTSESFESRRIRALGLTVRKVDAEYIKKHSLLNAEGLLVEVSEEGSPAHQAGLRKDDILQFYETAGQSILSWQPEPLTRSEELVRAVERSKEADTRLALIIKRGSFDGLVVFIRDFIQ